VTVIKVYFYKVLWSQIKYSETLLRSFWKFKKNLTF
jgi:hypothetical protein